MTDDRRTGLSDTPGNEARQIMAGFRAARARMAADPGMTARIASLADKTDHAVRQAQSAARDLDQALAIVGSLAQAGAAATFLAPQAPVLSRKRPNGTTAWVPEIWVLDTRKRLLNLAVALDRRRDEAGKVVNVLEDNLDIALAGVVGNVDEFTRARAMREAAHKVRLHLASAPRSVFDLASALADNHAEAAGLKAGILQYGGGKTKEDQAFLGRLNALKETLADIRRETVELAVSTAHGDLAGKNLGGLDMSGVDLTHVNLRGALLEGVLWSDSTRWPPGKEHWIRAMSQPVGRGTYRVTGPGPGPGRGQKPESLQA